MATLKQLAKQLQVCEGFVKSLTKGTKRGKDDFITLNTANCCRAVAQFTGYSTEERAAKAIRSNIRLLYMPSDQYANKLIKLSSKYGEKRKRILLEAATAIRTNNFTEYNRLIKSDKVLKETYKRKCAKSIKKELIDRLRSSGKVNRSVAKQILLSVGSQKGYKIVVPNEKIEKEVSRRVKRHGATASGFWQAAKQLNPKIKPDKLHKNKRRKHK